MAIDNSNGVNCAQVPYIGVYRKKPVVISAVLYDGSDESIAALNSEEFRGKAGRPMSVCDDKSIDIQTLEGVMKASIGDYIIKGVHGELYPCKPDIFAKTYDKIEQQKESTVASVAL